MMYRQQLIRQCMPFKHSKLMNRIVTGTHTLHPIATNYTRNAQSTILACLACPQSIRTYSSYPAPTAHSEGPSKSKGAVDRFSELWIRLCMNRYSIFCDI